MAGHLDSTSVFTVRLKALGIPDGYIAALIDGGVSTMARLAFISSVQPGVQDDAPFFTALAAALKLGGPDEIDIGSKASFRRAWFEASTVAIAEVRNKLERTDNDMPKKMPLPERNARFKDQQARLRGLRIEGHLEPSYALLDLTWSMLEEDQLKYLAPEVCTSRPQEILGLKRESFVKAEAGSGNLKQVQRDILPTADMSTEYRVKLALTRRALAFDNVGLCSFSALEEVHDFLYGLVMKEPLEMHHQITVQQILKADKQLWIRLIELTREGIATTASGSKPIETHLQMARLDPLFNALLQPLPKGSSGGYERQHKGHPEHNGPDSSGSGFSKGGKWKGGKGKGKGKGKGAKSMPEELKGLRSATNGGRPYCWNANTSEGCTFAKLGQFCNRGFHGCMKCGSPQHTFPNCSK